MHFRKRFSKGNVESVCGLMGVCSGSGHQLRNAIDIGAGCNSPMSKHLRIGRETMPSVQLRGYRETGWSEVEGEKLLP
jgi:hypothetical protein